MIVAVNRTLDNNPEGMTEFFYPFGVDNHFCGVWRGGYSNAKSSKSPCRFSRFGVGKRRDSVTEYCLIFESKP